MNGSERRQVAIASWSLDIRDKLRIALQSRGNQQSHLQQGLSRLADRSLQSDSDSFR